MLPFHEPQSTADNLKKPNKVVSRKRASPILTQDEKSQELTNNDEEDNAGKVKESMTPKPTPGLQSGFLLKHKYNKKKLEAKQGIRSRSTLPVDREYFESISSKVSTNQLP
jgi:hypothetical protein